MFFKHNKLARIIYQLYIFTKALLISFFLLSIYYTILFSFIPPQRTVLMLRRNLEYARHDQPHEFRHKWVPLEEISPYLIRAVIASEDNRFTQHYGLDFGAIEKARKHNERSSQRKRGASTISQQTAKNVFLWPARSYLRKGFEVYFTLMIETFWSKKRIMEVYLNMIEMGPNLYGAEAAAQHYYNKPAARLTKGEAALIAISLPNPRKRNPSRPTSYMLRRQQDILNLMPKLGEIDL